MIIDNYAFMFNCLKNHTQLNYNYDGSIFFPVGFEVYPVVSLFNDLRISKYLLILP